ncbi:hypothetical protein [Micromonospora sp. NPDC050495]|uniref:hypothetical protein n=1 Tax=Micromonospora sp. NPDC050495 TaxID=3154936 RepID=UPI0033F2F92C
MKAHRTDLVSFAFGLVFLALALWWLLARILGLTLPPVGWFLAGALILIGLLGLLGALRSGRHAGDGTAPQPVATVAAPYEDATPTSGVTGGVEADEWPGTAVTDDLAPAREDHPYGGGGEPRWSPARPPVGEDAPVTRELPVTDDPAGHDASTTRELPRTDDPDGPGGERRTGGDDAGPGGQRPG